MDNKELVVHFGAGSLGRGFIVPILLESGCNVTLVDANEELVNKLKETHSYTLVIADEEEGKQQKQIKVDRVLSARTDADILKDVLKTVKTVTTSVRQENLIHVAKTISEVWGNEENSDRAVICCENLENASGYFKSLLADCARDEKQKERLMKIKVPDTMVDRGCSQSYTDPTVVYTERFYEIGVDKKELPDTGIRLIPSVDNLEQHFYRKRFLLNTRVDALAFVGLYYGLNNFAELKKSEKVMKEITPYFELVKKSLEVGFGMQKEEVEKWASFYWNERGKQSKKASSKDERKLVDIARDMWRKLSYDERFIKPLVVLKRNGYEIDSGIHIIVMMVKYLAKEDHLSKAETLDKIGAMWRMDETGEAIYDSVAKMMD
jgi:Mannitol-1-phosphate/altronate dehydrogenases